MMPATAASMAMITRMTARTTAPVRRPPDVPTELICPPRRSHPCAPQVTPPRQAAAAAAREGLAFCWSCAAKGMFKYRQALAEQLVADHQRRQEPQHVPERATGQDH